MAVYDRKGGKAIARKADAPGKRPATVRGLAPGKSVSTRMYPLRSSGDAASAGALNAAESGTPTWLPDPL